MFTESGWRQSEWLLKSRGIFQWASRLIYPELRCPAGNVLVALALFVTVIYGSQMFATVFGTVWSFDPLGCKWSIFHVDPTIMKMLRVDRRSQQVRTGRSRHHVAGSHFSWWYPWRWDPRALAASCLIGAVHSIGRLALSAWKPATNAGSIPHKRSWQRARNMLLE